MYFILGIGIQSKAIVKYLLDNTDEEIKSFDPAPSEEVLKDLQSRRWTHVYSRAEDIFRYSGNSITVISCLPTQLNPDIARGCASKGWGYVDLGGRLEDTEEVIKHHKTARSSGCTLVPDCGVAPGLVSSIAGYLDKNEAKAVHIYCGGLPKHPKEPLNYIKAFMPEGVVKEYTGVVEIIKDGKLEYVPALSGVSKVLDTPLGDLEAVYTSGSVSLTPRALKNLKNFSYKTVRYAPTADNPTSHWSYVKNNIMWQPNPVEIFDKMTEPVGPSNPDLLYLRVFSDKHELLGDPIKAEWVWNYDYENNISAMAQITGYTVAAAATMIHEGKLPEGVVEMHDVDFVELKERICKMPNQFCRE